jgi:60 kDa SS-A/Ro ribonucleoprotein
MATKNLFSSKKSGMSAKNTKATNTVNNAGGNAYSLSDAAALAQYAMTGCFNSTFYTSDKDQLSKTLELANKCDPKFVAKLAIYSRTKGLMKDMPAVLTAVVASKSPELLPSVFAKVIDNPKMLRTFVQVMRSGATGRKSLGTRPKKLIQKFLENLTDDQLFKADIGNDPSLKDIIKMVHPKPNDPVRSAMYAYLLDKQYDGEKLTPLVKKFENFKKDLSSEIPEVPFQMLTALQLTNDHWKSIAKNATWTQTRMNLNTFARHSVFNDSSLIDLVSNKLKDKEQVKRAKVFPYQIYSAFINSDNSIPNKITLALQDAAEYAIENIPDFNGKVYVMVDTSGSMSTPVTGYRGTASSSMRCIDVAALVGASILRKNPDTEIIPFDTKVHTHKLNPRDSIMTNAETLSGFGGGGTDCSIALHHLNNKKASGDLVIYISDNESWVDTNRYRSTATMTEWNKFKTRNPKAKLICIDVVPGSTTQAHDRDDILNIGGFSDNVFDVIKTFMEFGSNKDLWVKTINSVEL